MAIKENDFVEINYTGKVKDGGEVFDTTNEALAKEHQIHNPRASYKPVIICVGKAQLLKGIDNALIGKEPGTFTIELTPEDAFGKKDAKLMQMIPMNKFKEQNIKPMPGLRLNIDNHMGTVRAISGGRVIVDFNHPLAGKDLVYDIEVKRIVTDKAEQVQGMLLLLFGLQADVAITDNKAMAIVEKALPTEFAVEAAKQLGEILDIGGIEFRTKESAEKQKAENTEKPAPESDTTGKQ